MGLCIEKQSEKQDYIVDNNELSEGDTYMGEEYPPNQHKTEKILHIRSFVNLQPISTSQTDKPSSSLSD